MVEDRITDGKRIGQLLASEFTGLERGPLADVEVVDADRDAEPSADGTAAYGVACHDDRVGTVYLLPDSVRIELAENVSVPEEWEGDVSAQDGLDASASGDGGATITVASGAAAKRAADAVAALLG